MNKTISIIIPCYNYAHYLGECIESVLRQTHKADEIIVVDDESTDNIKEVVSKYPVRYFWQKNKGLSGARNTGIAEAKSNYIMCLDADDMIRPDAIKEHLAIAGEKVIAQCGLMYFGTQSAVFRPVGATLESLLKSNTVYCNSVFPKKGWEEVGGYDEGEVMRLGLEDWEFWVRLVGAGYVVKTSDYIALLYRRHPNTMTKQTTHPNFKKLSDYIYNKNKHLIGL